MPYGISIKDLVEVYCLDDEKFQDDGSPNFPLQEKGMYI